MYFDGRLVVDARDNTFKEGMVGFWTRADSVTYSDDLIRNN